jgi:FG-GAP repeat protein
VRRFLAIALLGAALGGCTSAFYLTDADVATYTAQLGTETSANDTLATWRGALIQIEFSMVGSGATRVPRIRSSNLRAIFRERGAGRFPSESLDRAGAEVERELDTWIGPELASLADRLGAKLTALTRVTLSISEPPVFRFDPAQGLVNFSLAVEAWVTGDVYVAEVDETYRNVQLGVNDYRVTGALSVGAPHPQGTRVRLTATPRPGRLSVTGISNGRVRDAVVGALQAPLTAPVDITRALSYGQFAVPTLQFGQDPPRGGLWAGLATAPARAGASWVYRAAQWDRWATYPESQVLTGDFNGDGKTDVVMYRQAIGDWTVNLSTGSGFTFRAW